MTPFHGNPNPFKIFDYNGIENSVTTLKFLKCVNNYFNYYFQLTMLYECIQVRHVSKNIKVQKVLDYNLSEPI